MEQMYLMHMQNRTHNITGFIRYVVGARGVFYLHPDNTRLVHDILNVVTILADYFT